MRLGFSTVACPNWDLDTIIKQAVAFGYSSVELCGFQGQIHLPAAPMIASDPAAVSGRFREAGIELVCLATQNSLHWPDRGRLGEERARIRETIELAGKLGCKFVRVLPGVVPPMDQKQSTLVRIAGALRELGPVAAANQTTVLIENHGEFTSSRDLWFLVDSANHPAVQCCWNPCLGVIGGERPGLAVPRISRMIGMVHMLDAKLGPDGKLQAYELPGNGDLDTERILDLIRGVAYSGDLIVYWPRRSIPTLAEPETALPAARAALQAALEKLAATKELTAYKGDKNVPKYATPAA